MYRNCIFCSGEFGTNDCLEAFPVGRRLAYDPAHGRLWAVCPVCARWNLAPIEERWEALEAAEQLYRDARTRVQYQNIGIARLADDTRLIRVGDPLEGELAAWRYGAQLVRRRKRYLLVGAAATTAMLAIGSGVAAAGVGAGGALVVGQWALHRVEHRIIYRLDDGTSSTGRPSFIRRWHIRGMSVRPSIDDDAFELHVSHGRQDGPPWRWTRPFDPEADSSLIVSGAPARSILARVMTHVNNAGASRAAVDGAIVLLAQAHSTDDYIRSVARQDMILQLQGPVSPGRLYGPAALALEMALNEEAERRALEGELSALQSAWREAEEIAAIADALPGEVALNRLLSRFEL